jgi:endogenous inhibitor of DNA gyrase (YacG/DUF329 family)
MRRFGCPSCGGISTQDEWDNSTTPLCTNRVERRRYETIGSKKGGHRWYKCPKCGEANYNHNIKEVSNGCVVD